MGGCAFYRFYGKARRLSELERNLGAATETKENEVNMAQETIFVQTDPSFDIVLRSLNELNIQGRLQVKHQQTAVISRIQSNNPDNKNRYLFGEESESCIQAFARTATSVARMCMLRATNVNETYWPKMGARSGSRNKAVLNGQGQNQAPGDFGKFILAQTKAQAKRYYSKYDHLYPHFLIEHEFRSAGTNHEVFLPSMMLIIDSNFTQVVEITTTFRAKRLPREINLFHGYIHVVCIVRSIDEEGADEKFTKLLKGLVEGDSDGNRFSVKKEYFEVLSKATKKKGLKLPDLFHNLSFDKPKEKEESEEEESEEEESEKEESEEEYDEEED